MKWITEERKKTIGGMKEDTAKKKSYMQPSYNQ